MKVLVTVEPPVQPFGAVVPIPTLLGKVDGCCRLPVKFEKLNGTSDKNGCTILRCSMFIMAEEESTRSLEVRVGRTNVVIVFITIIIHREEDLSSSDVSATIDIQSNLWIGNSKTYKNERRDSNWCWIISNDLPPPTRPDPAPPLYSPL